MEYAKYIGWMGTLFYVLGYLLLSLRVLSADKKMYHILNVLGALGLIVNALDLEDLPGLAVNVVWLLIAIGAIVWIGVKK